MVESDEMSPRLIVVLSGPVSSGKTRLAERFSDRLGYVHIAVRQLLRGELAASIRGPTRRELQEAGARLEEETQGRWLAEMTALRVAKDPARGGYVVDAARTVLQVRGLREIFGEDLLHIHLSAKAEILEGRFEERRNQLTGEADSYSAATTHRIEAGSADLAAISDIEIDTSFLSLDQVFERAAARLG